MHYGLTFLIFYTFVISDFTSSRTLDDEPKNRSKRSYICSWGLTDTLKEAISDVLLDAHKFDPLYLGDALKGKLKDGVLKGLSTLELVSDIEVNCIENDLIVFVSTIGMGNTETTFRWKSKRPFKFTGNVTMKAEKARFQLEVHLNTAELTFKVKYFLLTKLKEFKFKFSGLGPLNPVVTGLINLSYKVWRKKVTKKIESIIKKALEKKLNGIMHMVRSYVW